MRGKVVHQTLGKIYDRITPAYAGKSCGVADAVLTYRDHPRLCGEKVHKYDVLHAVQGSPPPMRGKEKYGLHPQKGGGITPAYAGKSPVSAAPLLLQ